MQGGKAKQRTPNRLRELREEAGLASYDIAAKFRVDQSTVSRWENGVATPPYRMLEALADFFEVTVDYLMSSDRAKNGTAAKRAKTESAA